MTVFNHLRLIPILILLISETIALLDLDLSLKLNLLGGKKSPPKSACMPPLPLLPFIPYPSPASSVIVDNINPNKNIGGANNPLGTQGNSMKPTNGQGPAQSSIGSRLSPSGRSLSGDTVEKPTQLNRAPGRSSSSGTATSRNGNRNGGGGQMNKNVVHGSDSRSDPVGIGSPTDQRFAYDVEQRGRRAGRTGGQTVAPQSRYQTGVTNARQPGFDRGFGGNRRVVTKINRQPSRPSSNPPRHHQPSSSLPEIVPRGMSPLIVAKAGGHHTRRTNRDRRIPSRTPQASQKISETKKRPAVGTTTPKTIMKVVRGKLL